MCCYFAVTKVVYDAEEVFVVQWANWCHIRGSQGIV
jgi:hypothetical protein